MTFPQNIRWHILLPQNFMAHHSDVRGVATGRKKTGKFGQTKGKFGQTKGKFGQTKGKFCHKWQYLWLLAHPIKFGKFFKDSIFGRFNEHINFFFYLFTRSWSFWIGSGSAFSCPLHARIICPSKTRIMRSDELIRNALKTKREKRILKTEKTDRWVV